MGFGNGSYGKVWTVEDHGNYVSASMTISKKTKDGKYEKVWQDGRVAFLGEAQKLARTLSGGETIHILECDVTNKYSKEKKTMYTNYAIYKFEIGAGKIVHNDTKKEEDNSFVNVSEETMDEELPFN